MKPLATIDGRAISYLPLEDLLENMRQQLIMPYKSNFSFLPLIAKMHKRVEDTHCEMTAAMVPQVEALEQQLHASQGNLSEELREAVDGLTKMLLPAMYFEGEYGFVCPPFVKEFIYATPAMTELYEKDKWLVKITEDFLAKKEYGSVQNVAAVILNRFYDQNIDLNFRERITFRNVQSGREMHLRLDVREDYIDIQVNGELRKISEKEMSYLLDNFTDDDVVLEYLPADKFQLNGMGIGIFTDVSDMEIQSLIKDSVLHVGNVKPSEFIDFLQQQLNDYLVRKDVKVGMVDLLFQQLSDGLNQSISGHADFNSLSRLNPDSLDSYPYLDVFLNQRVVLVPNLEELTEPSKYELGLLNHGIRSAIFIPMVDNTGKSTGIVEIGSETPYAFNQTHVKKLRPIIELLALGNEVYLSDFHNKVERFIKTKFTAIHPSVEWKFEEIAGRHQVIKETQDIEPEIDPVVFQDVYPLYGQVDIRHSSDIRNKAIQDDLVSNLERAIEVIKAYQNFVNFHLLDAYITKAQNHLFDLKEGYTSRKESATVDLLSNDVHPLLEQLSEQFPEIPRELKDDYFADLDHDMGIVNRNRREYEASVNKLNKTLSNFLEDQNEKQQQVLPHYFEKYKTDGVEYNLYLGQSLLKDLKFSRFHLQDFRLWQLMKTVEMTQLTADLRSKLAVPLETAQLIFVYNTPLSIRFRMEEKRFDVDGTYNVRYEILKKRIDKATVKGSGERLTQAGKIAIVYLLDKDREEYMEYLKYLAQQNLITNDIEDLDLEHLQGADGLRALRVTVNSDATAS